MPLPWFPWFKIAVFALLACNAIVFGVTGTASEALDAVAWFTLLVLFELETDFGDRFSEKPAATAIHAIRLMAAIAIGAAAVSYVSEEAWLNAANAWLWIAVVVLLEIEVRHPHAVGRHRAAFSVVAAILYSGLAAVVAIWAWRREWFDAYDALLWLIAFATIEINVLRMGASSESAPELGDKAG